ncbi:MAG: hypothetical protein ACLU9S_24135 [Oscillospiraceae bacterium]
MTAATWAKIGAVTTLVNAVVAVAVASAFTRPPPRPEHAGLLKRLKPTEYGKENICERRCSPAIVSF